MKTIHQIAEAAYGAYLKALKQMGIEQPPFYTCWDDLPLRNRLAYQEGIRHALAEAAVAPITMPAEEVPLATTSALASSDPEGHRQAMADHEAEQSLDTSEADARQFPAWGAP